ncbi:TetR/AcrR family transcriptional regulator [Noviherbaspirillum saxi]|uniref:TetR/AcrR family transcriptional regulator n=1 Tax=Noviherbaspirillum saxi TaxID=2320863 RepID=A0A3A3G2U6_9BURK|nr:TetR/AcrR family transcriptional regulator [Noviherbaspirillum saxi]RJF95746.1 TetR/AcrR family transcriptional regulator [Noviherbaspirillum saxi]
MLKSAESRSHEVAPTGQARKGTLTRKAIIEEALQVAYRDGLKALSFGTLAERLHMSKAGVFVHFGSIQALQTETLKQYCLRFVENVVLPSLAVPRGLPRLEAMFSRWVCHVTEHRGNGCRYISHAAEYDIRSGSILHALRNEAILLRKTVEGAIQRAVEEGHLRKDTDVKQFAFEVSALIFGLHHDTWFMRDCQSRKRAERAFIKLLDGYRPPPDLSRPQL